jgi:hypothetical protein
MSDKAQGSGPHGTAVDDDHGHPRTVHVLVFAPRFVEPRPFDWAVTLKVGEAAKEAATAFGYTAGHPGLQTDHEPPRTLENNKTLAEEHVHDNEKLELIDTGGGV